MADALEKNMVTLPYWVSLKGQSYPPGTEINWDDLDKTQRDVINHVTALQNSGLANAELTAYKPPVAAAAAVALPSVQKPIEVPIPALEIVAQAATPEVAAEVAPEPSPALDWMAAEVQKPLQPVIVAEAKQEIKLDIELPTLMPALIEVQAPALPAVLEPTKPRASPAKTCWKRMLTALNPFKKEIP